jgi:hypothetical protein
MRFPTLRRESPEIVKARKKARAVAQRRRRMSLERLALCHIAVAGRELDALAARMIVSQADLEGVVFGPTFADTLALSRPFFDLYEEEAHVGRRCPSSPVSSLALRRYGAFERSVQ